MLNVSGIKGKLRNSLWAEAANCETDVENLLVNRKDYFSAQDKCHGNPTKYKDHVHTFGNICVEKRKDSTMRSKFQNKGIPCMILGYANDNASDTYRMLNLETERFIKSRNLRWLNISYKNWIKDNSDDPVQDDSNSDTDSMIDDVEDSTNQGGN